MPRTFIKLLLLSMAIPSIHLAGLEWEASVSALPGYRQDKITTDIDVIDGPAGPLETVHLTISDIQIAEFGLKAELALENRLLLRGSAKAGYAINGKSHEQVKHPGLKQTTTGRVKGDSSQDYALSIGYRLPLSPCLGIAALGGYSFNRLQVKIHNTKEDGIADPDLEGLKYTMDWQGPWLGCEASYCRNYYHLQAGYEYHKSNWHAKYKQKDHPVAIDSFSDHRSAKNSHGNIAYIDSLYTGLCYVDIGARIEYQYWTAKHGKATPVTDQLNLLGFIPGQKERVTKATWQSVGIQLHIAFSF